MGSDPVLVSSAAPLPEFVGALKDALWGEGPAVFCYDALKLPVLRGPVPREAAVVVETSGTTGTPKQVWLSKDAVLSSARATSHAAGPAGLWWLALPTHYIAGLQVVVRSLVAGYEPIVASAGLDIVGKLQESLPQLKKAKAEGISLYCSLVPTQLAQLIDAVEKADLDSDSLAMFDRILVGGQRVEPQLLERAEASGLAVTRTYGSAETAGGCVWDGVPLGGASLDIVDCRVALSGPMLAGGYIGDEDQSRESFIERDGQRWFVSRDLGEILDGLLVVTGRLDDVIISGGVKVSLAEVERVVREQGGVGDAIVVALPDSHWGDVPVVVSTHGCDLDSIRSLVKAGIGPAAQPKHVVTLDAIPLLPSGKPYRQAIQALATQRLTYDK